MYEVLTCRFGLAVVFIIGIGVIIYAIAKAIKAWRYLKVVYPFEIDGNKGHRKSWIERFLDASDIADECERCL